MQTAAFPLFAADFVNHASHFADFWDSRHLDVRVTAVTAGNFDGTDAQNPLHWSLFGRNIIDVDDFDAVGPPRNQPGLMNESLRGQFIMDPPAADGVERGQNQPQHSDDAQPDRYRRHAVKDHQRDDAD